MKPKSLRREVKALYGDIIVVQAAVYPGRISLSQANYFGTVTSYLTPTQATRLIEAIQDNINGAKAHKKGGAK